MAEGAAESESSLEGGAYDVLHRRLVQHGETLRERLDALNARRAETFGSIETKLLATRRINTPHPCVPRDMAAVGRRFLFGFNVHFGLKTQIEPPDVFGQYRYGDDGELHAEPLTLIDDERFRKDFTELYRFYKGATFAKFFGREPHLYMKFRIGRSVDDFKAFKFALDTGAGAATSVAVSSSPERAQGSRVFEDTAAEAAAPAAPVHLEYLDNRSDHEVRYPSPHDFTWTRAGRDAQRPGRFPHVAIDDRVFVETVGGDLTIKVEDSTDTGQGILSEPVDDPDQTLDDAEISYVVHGHLILLRVRPYNERGLRHFIVNTKLQEAVRVDALEHACRMLPDDHGLIFANGYYRATGELQTFPNVPPDMVFERRVAAPNGEDFLYVFYNRESGRYALLSYNLIAQSVETPTVCNGFAILPDGELLLFRAGEEASRHHAIQVWQTPYVGPDHVAAVEEADRQSFLYKIGNAEVVRGMAECREVLGLIERDQRYADLYVDIARTAQDLLDSYHWLDLKGEEESGEGGSGEGGSGEGGLAEPLRAIRDAAQAAVGEFEKVRRQRTHAAELVAETAKETDELVRRVETAALEGIEGYVEALASLRAVRGRLIALREVKYVDAEAIDRMEERVATQAARVGHRAVEFLLEDRALDPYRQRTAELAEHIGEAATVARGREVEAELTAVAADLELLIDTVSNLPIEDATQRTRIVDAVSDVFASMNAARSRLQSRLQELGRSEGVAEFNSQLKLLSGSVTNLLSLCDTPERCDELMTRALVQVEELEGRFAEFDGFVVELAERREEIVAAFEARKLELQERRNARTEALTAAAERVLRGVGVRAAGMKTVEELAGFFAADVMVAKVRDLADELETLGDTVRAQGVRGQLKAAREEAVRRLEDRRDLMAGEGEDGNRIRLGRHVFGVSQQPLDLTTVFRDGRLHLHITGTRYFEPIDDPAFEATREVWDQSVVSESEAVYRGEYLAHLIYIKGSETNASEPAHPGPGSARTRSDEEEGSGTGGGTPRLAELCGMEDEALAAYVQRFASTRYAEGYTRGVHDHDAALILRALLDLDATIGPLRYAGEARALASVYWHTLDDAARAPLAARLAGVARMAKAFPHARGQERDITELAAALATFAEASGGFDPHHADAAARALHDERTAGEGDDEEMATSAVSPEAAALHDALLADLQKRGETQRFEASIEAVASQPLARYRLLRAWVAAFAASESSEPGRLGPGSEGEGDASGATEKTGSGRAGSLNVPVDETAALLFTSPRDFNRSRIVDASIRRTVTGLVGSHPRIDPPDSAADDNTTRGGRLTLDFPRFLDRLATFRRIRVPMFERFTASKKQALDDARRRLRVGEFTPQVLTTFVRNRLIDTVFLPLIGDNFAKQIGTAGDGQRTDTQSLLLLISPPGYGKTTLMEYVAARLGLAFVKINGPALGHAVTSLDPAAAPNAAAAQELTRLNLALELGDNVLLMLDDIQHCHPELLQKFIPLCDAQREIEGVWRGEAKTHDLRGRKFAVVMAGNPFTESGERFQVPDMLANRADTYNLGDMLGGHADAFRLSYLENAVTSNAVLREALSTHAREDVPALVRIMKTGSREGIDLAGSYTADELRESIEVVRRLLTVRDAITDVNDAYIRSAGIADAYRTEPPFLLQGSYRNMNRIASRVSPVMNEEELWTLINSSYEQDAQALTTGAESNLLKFYELTDQMTLEQSERWELIKKTFRRNNAIASLGGDEQAAAVLAQLSHFNEGLTGIREALTQRAGPSPAPASETLTHPLQASFDPAALQVLQALADAATRAASQSDNNGDGRPHPPQEIRIVNKVPATFLYVMKEQFELMKHWLEPLTRLSADQDDKLASLTRALRDISARYDTMIQRLESSREVEVDITADDSEVTQQEDIERSVL